MAACKQCSPDNHREFACEVAIHFPGTEGLDKPVVWVFPKALVCLSCGFTKFMVPPRELQAIVEDKATERSECVQSAG